MAKTFKVGDKVKIVKGSEYDLGNARNPSDTIGEITEVRKGYEYEYRVAWPKGNNAYRPHDLELAEEVEVTAKTVSLAAFEALQAQGMKLGSTVKILSSWPSSSEGFKAKWTPEMDKTIGKIGIVNQWTVYEDHVRVRVTTEDPSDFWWYPTMVLQLIESEPKDVVAINESVYLSEFNENSRTAVAVLQGGSNIITYDEIADLHTAITKKTISVAGHNAVINYQEEYVKIGCQMVSFEKIKKAYNRTQLSKSATSEEPKREFKVGDRVEYYRELTEAEWKGVGEVHVPFKIGQVLTIRGIWPVTKSLSFDGSIYGFPHQAFRLV